MSNPVEGPGLILVPGNNAYQLLWELPNANMQLTTDQVFQKMFNGTQWDPQLIVAYWKSGAFNTACVGGVFTGASKTGSAIVAVGQSYAGLTGVNTHVNVPVQAATTTFSVSPILSLATGNSAALVADLRIYGIIVN